MAIANADRISAAALRRFGSRCRLRRRQDPEIRAFDGSDATPWEDVPDGDDVELLLQPISAVLAQRLWGTETKATFKAYVRDVAPVAKQQGLLVTARDYEGWRFRVVELDPYPSAGLAVLGLEATQETFD